MNLTPASEGEVCVVLGKHVHTKGDCKSTNCPITGSTTAGLQTRCTCTAMAVLHENSYIWNSEHTNVCLDQGWRQIWLHSATHYCKCCLYPCMRIEKLLILVGLKCARMISHIFGFFYLFIFSKKSQLWDLDSGTFWFCETKCRGCVHKWLNPRRKYAFLSKLMFWKSFDTLLLSNFWS